MAEDLDTSLQQIDDLWRQHLAEAFPVGLAGHEIDGIDLVLLDADIAGCISTFVDTRNLNLFQTAVLGLSYKDVASIVLESDGNVRTYFSRLEKLAGLVLRAVANGC